MGKLRKRLAVFFGCLSAICALIAVRNHIHSQKNQSKAPEEIPQKWCRQIEPYARKTSKLIFVNTNSLDFKPSKAIKKILSQKYISVEISPDTFPADYFILDSLLARNARIYRPLKAGILSPNLYPIYLTSQYSSRLSHNAPTLDEALIVAVKHFEKNPYELKLTARNAVKFDSLPQSFFSRLSFSDMFAQLSFIHTESANLFIYFNSQKPIYDAPAIVSENARLISKICATDINLSARQALINATKILCKRIQSKDENLTAKLLYLRALGESPFITTNKNLYSFYLTNLKNILPKEKNIDANLYEYNKMATRDIALMASVLSKASVISGSTKLRKEAEDMANFLANKMESSTIFPAKIGAESEASSLEYVLCIRAFYDIAKLSNNEKWLQTAFNTISKWNDNFMTELNLWSINSKKSAFAKYTRPIITRDNTVPSYIGEASQLFVEIGINNSPTAQMLKKISTSAMSDSPLSSHNWASLKLAVIPQFAPPTL